MARAICRRSSGMTALYGKRCDRLIREERRRRSPSCPRLGFRAAATPIEMYDARMTPAIAAEIKAGDLGTRWPKQNTRLRAMATGEHSGMHMATMTGYGRVPFSDVAFAGGHLYLDVMRHLVDFFREPGHVVGDARITEINGAIGIMRRDLRRWLDREFAKGY
jgi:hypothetical protein